MFEGQGSHARVGMAQGLAVLVGIWGISAATHAQESGMASGANPAGPPSLRADAGDDQIAVVSRQVTLAGQRSQPCENVGFRWIQVGGPPVRLQLEQGMYLSFVPEEPGRYRFALMIAAGNRISEPATVEVAVQPDKALSRISPGVLPSLEEQIRASLRILPEGPALAAPLAGVFDRVAQRMDLYASYDEAFQEMSRQLDAIVPPDPLRRRAWIEGLFQPLTGQVIEALRADGLDLRLPGARTAPLTPAQKNYLSVVFHTLAAGARGAGSLSSR